MEEKDMAETDFSLFWVEDGIMKGKIKPNSVLDTEAVKKIVRSRIELSKGITYPLLLDQREMKFIDKGGREYYSSEEGHALISGAAVLVGSIFSRIAGNIYLNYNTPRLPFRLFTDEKAAIRWLQQFKKL